jgi:hypothetical protein
MATNPGEVCRVIVARDGKLESTAESSADENSGNALIDSRLHGIAWITPRKRRYRNMGTGQVVDVENALTATSVRSKNFATPS